MDVEKLIEHLKTMAGADVSDVDREALIEAVCIIREFSTPKEKPDSLLMFTQLAILKARLDALAENQCCVDRDWDDAFQKAIELRSKLSNNEYVNGDEKR